ncbi:MAG: glycosyltransferase [Candidatus Babeliales bacterium]
MRSKNICFYSVVALLILSFLELSAARGKHKKPQQRARSSKIVAFMQVRNEENIIAQSLRCLLNYVDAMVILDDASTDSTPFILMELQKELPIVEIIFNKESAWEAGRESDNQQQMLEAARRAGGTHFIFMDADEIISANCLTNGYLRSFILSLQPGEKAALRFLNLWRSPYKYRSDKSPYGNGAYRPIIFCDYPGASYEQSFLHGARYPEPLPGKLHQLPEQYVVLHFQFVNWNNLLAKQAWYRCLEHVKGIQSVADINKRYRDSKNEKKISLKRINTDWLSGYKNFDVAVYDLPVQWRTQQVNDWFDQYGKDFFKDLDIWDVNWENA